jgi:hypothetical protein
MSPVTCAGAGVPGTTTTPEKGPKVPITGDVETFYQDGAWRNRVEGSGTSALAFPTMAEAAEVGRAEAERAKSAHVVKDQAGRIVEQSTYALSPSADSGS